ncbi:hypothetical protein PIROE2DRAFT_58727 [Piromyces sp. E2]|nr:hypothetical protein PIROE2DRAFT_58727 [Piromyces sp. E2]|eukprot:OUM67498.1 hypothetical protein PIROE2DRAFT_58727 [Piromyces sp. E2]
MTLNIYANNINSTNPPPPGTSEISNYSVQPGPPGTTGISNYSLQPGPPGTTGISNYSLQPGPPGTSRISNYTLQPGPPGTSTTSFTTQPPPPKQTPPAFPPTTTARPPPPPPSSFSTNTNSKEQTNNKSYSQVKFSINSSAIENKTFKPEFISVVEKINNSIETKKKEEEMKKKAEKKKMEYPQSLKDYITRMYAICPKNKREVLEEELKKLIRDAQLRNVLCTVKWENMGLPT